MLPLQILRLRGEAWSYPECHCTWIAHCALNRVCLSHKTLEPLHKIQSRVAGLDDIAGETSAQQLGWVLKPQNCLTSRHERQEQQPPPRIVLRYTGLQAEVCCLKLWTFNIFTLCTHCFCIWSCCCSSRCFSFTVSGVVSFTSFQWVSQRSFGLLFLVYFFKPWIKMKKGSKKSYSCPHFPVDINFSFPAWKESNVGLILTWKPKHLWPYFDFFIVLKCSLRSTDFHC